MAFCITFGTHDFRSELEEARGLPVQCRNCNNWNGTRVVKHWPFITICFVPVIPLYFKPKHDVYCDVCNRSEPLEHRPEVQRQMAERRDGKLVPAGQAQNATMSPAGKPQQAQQAQQPAPAAQYQPPPQGYYAPNNGQKTYS